MDAAQIARIIRNAESRHNRPDPDDMWERDILPSYLPLGEVAVTVLATANPSDHLTNALLDAWTPLVGEDVRDLYAPLASEVAGMARKMAQIARHMQTGDQMAADGASPSAFDDVERGIMGDVDALARETGRPHQDIMSECAALAGDREWVWSDADSAALIDHA